MDEMRHFLRDDDLLMNEQSEILTHAIAMKQNPLVDRSLEGKTVALMFDKPSTRTRVSFSVGVFQMGGMALELEGTTSQLGRGESIADTARVLGRQVDLIVWRTFGQERIEEMARWAGVPVINSLTNEFHPCQVLADLMTVQERKGELAGLTFAYVGDCNQNMPNSYLIGGAVAGMHVRLAGPTGFLPEPEVVTQAQRLAEQSGGSVEILENRDKAVDNADVIATDTWVSIDKAEEKALRAGPDSPFLPFQVDEATMARAKSDAIFLHCLPAYRGFEVTESVIDGPQSVVWDEAENRRHVQKALMKFLVAQ